MTCEESNNLISARIDGELRGSEYAALDAHLAECQACRMAISELESQNALLLRAFAPQRRRAAELSDAVMQIAAVDAVRRFPRRTRPIDWVVAAAIVGFAAGILFVRSVYPPPAASRPAALITPSQTAAQLVLATGDIFICPSSNDAWKPLHAQETIAVGASVKTAGASKCELRMRDGSRMRLNTGTEARFVGERVVQVSAGELWSTVPPDAKALCVSAGKTIVTAGGERVDGGAQFGLLCAADAATVSVLQGTADVKGNGSDIVVRAGEIMRPPLAATFGACTAIPDPLLSMQWQDDLITMKRADDPELLARVEQLITRITSASAETETPCSVEIAVRARGDAWCSSFACYLRETPRRGTIQTRRSTARLLADFATSARIAEMIDLLDDPDGDVRRDCAAALSRLTGQSPDHMPDENASMDDPALINFWRKWWTENNYRYLKR